MWHQWSSTVVTHPSSSHHPGGRHRRLHADAAMVASQHEQVDERLSFKIVALLLLIM